MKDGSDTRVWVLIAVVACAAVLLVAAFMWYLDSVGSADGPNEGLPSPTQRLQEVSPA